MNESPNQPDFEELEVLLLDSGDSDFPETSRERLNTLLRETAEARTFASELLFDDALPICLLYREERPQYESLQTDESLRLKRSCEIYGSTFLLRLLRRLPILLREESQNEMDDVGPLIADLIVLLQKNRQACFKESYRQPKEHELLECEKRIVLPTVGRTL